MCGWQVKLCDLSLTRAILSASEVSSHERRYTNVLSSTSTSRILLKVVVVGLLHIDVFYLIFIEL